MIFRLAKKSSFSFKHKCFNQWKDVGQELALDFSPLVPCVLIIIPAAVLTLVGHRLQVILPKNSPICTNWKILKNPPSAQRGTFWLAPLLKLGLKGDISFAVSGFGIIIRDGFYRWRIVWRAVTDPGHRVLPPVHLVLWLMSPCFMWAFSSTSEGVSVSSGLDAFSTLNTHPIGPGLY